MKSIPTTIAICLLALISHGQEWDLFPYRQNSLYRNVQTGKLQTIEVDSARIAGDTTLHYVFRNPDWDSTCRATIGDALWKMYPYTFQGDFLFSSLQKIQDTTFISGSAFLPKAGVGQAWVMAVSPKYREIKAVCNALTEATFAGVTDSIKTFRFATANPSPFSSIEFKLSKHYGMTLFFPFKNFTSSNPNTEMFELFSFSNDTLKPKYQPRYTDFIKFEAGDILVYKHTLEWGAVGIPRTVQYYRDSITSMEKIDGLLIYKFNRQAFDNNGEKVHAYGDNRAFSLEALHNFIQGPADWFIPAMHHCAGFLGLFPGIWQDEGSYVTITAADTLLQRSWSYWGADFVNCFIAEGWDVGHTISFDPEHGLSRECHFGIAGIPGGGGVSSTEHCLELIGSRIDGVQWGNVTLDVEEIPAYHLNIYPNPAKDVLHFSNDEIFNYKVIGITGQIILEGTCHQELNIQNLPVGMYILYLSKGEKFYTATFVKE